MSTPFARGPLLILLGALCFSTTGTVQALSPEGATPYVIGALRMLVGGLALLLWCAFRGELPRFWRWPMRCVVPSTLALLGFQFFFFRGVLEAGVAVGTVVAIGFSPIVVALLGLIFLREKPAKAWYPATGLALIGLILLNADAVGGASFAGMAFPLLAGFSYACYFVFSKPLARNALTASRAAGFSRGSGPKVISVPSTAGPPMAENSSEAMPSPDIIVALRPASDDWRAIRPPSVCRPPQ